METQITNDTAIEKDKAIVNDSASIASKTTDSDNNTTNDKADKTSVENTTALTLVSKSNEETTTQVIPLTHIDKDFAYELMSVPTNSAAEYRIITFIILWARKNNIKYEFDDYGNVYLTKGEVNTDEFYPCVTSHLDTVQTKQRAYAQAGVKLPIKTTILPSGKHKMSVDGMGIGADDKSGVLICLSLFNHVDKLKACFFLEEETGMKGSMKLNAEWFHDVGYVIGFDSPDLNRAAYCCSGTKLFDKTFFETYIKDVCKAHGVDDFRSEPFTDVIQIRNKTKLVCMNFGNGGYDAHGQTEYCILEDMDNACRMGHALINKIGNTQHILETTTRASSTSAYAYYDDADENYYREVAGKQPYKSSYSSQYYNNNSYKSSYSGTSTTHTTTVKNEPINNGKNVAIETLDYIVDVYEKHIEDIKLRVEAKCKDLGISFDEFKKFFDTTVSF